MHHEKKGIRGTVKALLILAVVCMTGCGGSSEQNVRQMETETAESGSQRGKEEAEEENRHLPEAETAIASEEETEKETGTENGAEAGITLGKEEKEQGEAPIEELVFASEDWGLSFGEPGAQPVGNASADDLAWYDAYYVGNGDEKVIYLTFDCGYENGNTEPILDALKKHNAPATFFVVGHFLETAPEMVKRMVEEGHAVGNHTYHHLDMPTISDKAMFQEEMDGVADLFYDITGRELSLYYRPPQGKCNTENLKMAQELGYSTIFWSLAYVDWDTDRQPGHEEAFDKLTSRIHPGAIVLLHNTSQTNGEILDELLTKWEAMGYCFKPLSELE